MPWTTADIPDLSGRRVIVTGANSGIGLAATAQLMAHGAAVTMAVRDELKGRAAAALVEDGGSGSIEVAWLDLADLASVRQFAATWREAHPEGLDVLVNNAGVMAIPRRESADGFELQLATNHLGHFALTGLLVGALRPDGRVVTVSSSMHRMGRIDFDDLQGGRSYQGQRAHNQSKLANVLFTYELARRLAGTGVTANAVHPGVADTSFGRADSGWWMRAMLPLVRPVMRSPEKAAATSVHLACAPELATVTGTYFANSRPKRSSPRSYDTEVARRLWRVSCELVGIDDEAL